MKKILFLLLCTVQIYGQTSTGQEQEFDYGIKNNSTQTITTPTYIGTFGTDGTQGKIPSALIAKTSDIADSLATKENIANKSDSYTVSSSTTYASTKAVVDGLATKENAFSKNTAFNKNFGITAGTVVEGGTLGSNAYSSTPYLPLTGGYVSGSVGIGTTSPNRKLEVADIDSQLSLKGSITGAPVYQTWYNSSNVRRGYFGFSSESNSDIRLTNEEVGNIYISPNNGSTIITSNVTAISFNGSATLTGTPTAPTAAPGTTGKQIATLDYVLADNANVVHKTGEETIGFGEKYFTDNVNFTDIAVSGQAIGRVAVSPNEFVIKSQLDLKAPLSSPTLTGTPTAPTAAPGTTGKQIATLDYVLANSVSLSANNTFTGENTFSNYTIFGAPAILKNYTVATLPEGNQGDIAYVTDALAPTYLTSVVGGGSVVCPVFYNGTTWVSH